MSHSQVFITGSTHRSGTYLLGINVHQPVNIVFGRFAGGQPMLLPTGMYLYLGSAMGQKGFPLARRLLRHTTRTGQKPPHAIQKELIGSMVETGLGNFLVKPSKNKTLHWHIDYLLDETAAEITQITIIRSEKRLEEALAIKLNANPRTCPLAKGLGASDHPGSTHLLKVTEPDQISEFLFTLMTLDEGHL